MNISDSIRTDLGRSRGNLQRMVAVLCLAVGTGLSLFAFYQEKISNEANVRSTLELRSEWRASDFRDKVADAAVPIEALSVALASYPNISLAQFHRLAVQARGQDPVARLAWWPRVSGTERAAFEQAARLDSPDFAIRGARSAGSLAAASDRDEYFPMRFEERFENVATLLGYDLSQDPTRYAAASRARDEGTAVSTPILTATDGDKRPSFNIIWPVYRDGGVPPTLEARHEKLRGYVSGLFFADDLFNFAIHDTPVIVETFSLLLDPPAGASLGIPAATYRLETSSVVAGGALATPDPSGLRLMRSFKAFENQWTLVFDYPASTVAALSSAARWGYLALGMALTLLIATNEMLQQRRRAACEVLVELRTRDLKRTSDQLTATIESSPSAIVCVDPSGLVTLWNRMAERIFGYSQEEVIGRQLPVIPKDDLIDFQNRLARIAKGELWHEVKVHRQRKGGTPIEVRYSAAPFHGSKGELIGVVFAMEDITERNEVERKLARAQKMETVGQLTGGLAHDFNNILGAVIGNLDLAEEKVLPDSPAAAYCQAALAAALSAAELVKRLLAFSRRQPLLPERVDLATIISNVLPLLERTLGEHIRVETSHSPHCWPAFADAVQLESAILNLAINARDAMPGGGVLSIDAANVSVDEAFAAAAGDLAVGDYATLSVTDTGTGMPPEVIGHAFEPFYTTKPTGEGSGLGLSMVFGTMTQLGGTVKIYSEVGVGTTIQLLLPRAAAMGEQTGYPAPVESDPVSTGNERILMVEDNAQVRAVGAGILRNLGYQVTLAESGDEAMRQIEDDTHFDLLFSDIVMAGRLNGIALAAELRARDSEIPILLTSGFSSPAHIREGVLDLGAKLIVKPYRRADLARVVRTLLDKNAQGVG